MTYNNVVSALRRAFAFGFEDHPEQHNPANALRSARIGKKDRPVIDPFSIQDAEVVIAAIHRDWGEAQGNYEELRFFTGLRPSEQIALVVSDFDAANGTLSVSKARVAGIDRDRTKTGEDRRIQLRALAQCSSANYDYGSNSSAPVASTISSYSSMRTAHLSVACESHTSAGIGRCRAFRSAIASPTPRGIHP